LSLPKTLQVVALIVWLAACVVPFLPFAASTSPLDALMLNVPGNQGNWWHFLAGLPFFLAFPGVWLSLQTLLGKKGAPVSYRIISGFAAISAIGTVLVEVPFLLHLAGTSAWQSFIVLGLGFGILLFSAAVLLFRRRVIPKLAWCIASIIAAYLANASLCLVVYASSPGAASTRTGWFVTMVLVWPLALELLWLLTRSFRPES
jgi:hypothetical protein